MTNAKECRKEGFRKSVYICDIDHKLWFRNTDDEKPKGVKERAALMNRIGEVCIFSKVSGSYIILPSRPLWLGKDGKGVTK